ncbi:CbrC family protein [Luteolibacter pohnpeiensis]|uniref:CbrC family protein n=1 Tax=Luteolibacter pohnpeiensis TaxID=454153 RepID=A0A934SAA7_9BACT|nr:CbrC family protein [Luteolibacter pohnpeiensis]
MNALPKFPYHRDPRASGPLRESAEPCECCGLSRGILYSGVIYTAFDIKNLCPWCIADGSAASRFSASFFDANFCGDSGDSVSLPPEFHHDVFDRTIGFSTFNPIGWWVHCGEPAEYVSRNEPYEMIFECRICHKQHTIEDFD